MEEKSLSISFGDTLKSEAVSCIAEFAEVGLDSIFEDGLVKDIPFVSSIVSIYRIGNSIRERHNIKKLISFIKAINDNIVDESKRQEYVSKFNDNSKFRNKQLEYLLVLIDRYISYDKPQMLAKLYLAYLDDIISWEELTMYAEVIDRFLLLDCRTLISADDKVTVHRNIGGESVLRLEALGLMTETNENSIFEQTNGRYGISAASMQRFSSNDKTYIRTEFGDKLAIILR